MASYLSYDAADGRYHVGPPVAGAAERGQQGSLAQRISDPTFELTQFAVTLTVANEWRARLGQQPNASWARMVSLLAPAPLMREPSPRAVSPAPPPGPPAPMIYNQNVRQQAPIASSSASQEAAAQAACTGAYTADAQLCEGDTSHPAVLLALGMLPGEAHGISAAAMNRTLDVVLETWDFPAAWGWDFGLMAMTAARLGRTDAVDILMQNTTKNGYLACGCNAPLTCYLPGNGALLAAVSMMANLEAFPPSWAVV